MKYNIDDIDTETLRRVANNTIIHYLKNDINYEMWGWECNRVKQQHEPQNN
jgi:hypothetical protein